MIQSTDLMGMATLLAFVSRKLLNLARVHRHSVCYHVGMPRWSWCVLLAASVGCYSPTLPLPPPLAPSEESAGTNLVHLHGGINSVNSDATVLIQNNDTQFMRSQQITATLPNPDGSWDATVFAVKGDTLEIWQIVGTSEEGDPLYFMVMVN